MSCALSPIVTLLPRVILSLALLSKTEVPKPLMTKTLPITSVPINKSFPATPQDTLLENPLMRVLPPLTRPLPLIALRIKSLIDILVNRRQQKLLLITSRIRWSVPDDRSILPLLRRA